MAKVTVKELREENEALKTEIGGLRKLLISVNAENEREVAQSYVDGFMNGIEEGVEDTQAAYKAQTFIDRLFNREPVI